jgi:hypothetical protein
MFIEILEEKNRKNRQENNARIGLIVKSCDHSNNLLYHNVHCYPI